MSNTIQEIKPLHDNVLIQVIEREGVSKGGIYIPPTAKDHELSWRASVIAVGPGRLLENGRRVEPNVRVGETVLLGKYMGTELEIEGIKYVIVKEEHILGVEETA